MGNQNTNMYQNMFWSWLKNIVLHLFILGFSFYFYLRTWFNQREQGVDRHWFGDKWQPKPVFANLSELTDHNMKTNIWNSILKLLKSCFEIQFLNYDMLNISNSKHFFCKCSRRRKCTTREKANSVNLIQNEDTTPICSCYCPAQQ